MIASLASRRFETSFSGSCEAEDVDAALGRASRRSGATKSPPTGREPTRKRPRSASASGVFVRALSARIRSHGLSTPRLTAVSKHAAARDLEVGEAGAVEDLGEAQLLRGRHHARERLLAEQAEGRVDERRHLERR